jgi:hypothetical protein
MHRCDEAVGCGDSQEFNAMAFYFSCVKRALHCVEPPPWQQTSPKHCHGAWAAHGPARAIRESVDIWQAVRARPGPYALSKELKAACV